MTENAHRFSGSRSACIEEEERVITTGNNLELVKIPPPAAQQALGTSAELRELPFSVEEGQVNEVNNWVLRQMRLCYCSTVMLLLYATTTTIAAVLSLSCVVRTRDV